MTSVLLGIVYGFFGSKECSPTLCEICVRSPDPHHTGTGPDWTRRASFAFVASHWVCGGLQQRPAVSSRSDFRAPQRRLKAEITISGIAFPLQKHRCLVFGPPSVPRASSFFLQCRRALLTLHPRLLILGCQTHDRLVAAHQGPDNGAERSAGPRPRHRRDARHSRACALPAAAARGGATDRRCQSESRGGRSQGGCRASGG